MSARISGSAVVEDSGRIGVGPVVTLEAPGHACAVGSPACRVGWGGRGGARVVPLGGAGSQLRCPTTGAELVDHGDHLEPA